MNKKKKYFSEDIKNLRNVQVRQIKVVGKTSSSDQISCFFELLKKDIDSKVLVVKKSSSSSKECNDDKGEGEEEHVSIRLSKIVYTQIINTAAKQFDIQVFKKTIVSTKKNATSMKNNDNDNDHSGNKQYQQQQRKGCHQCLNDQLLRRNDDEEKESDQSAVVFISQNPSKPGCKESDSSNSNHSSSSSECMGKLGIWECGNSEK